MNDMLLAIVQGGLEGIIFGLIVIMILLFIILIKEFMRYM